MAGQQRVYTDEEIAKLEAAEKAKKGLTDLEILRLERAQAPAPKPAVPAVDKITAKPKWYDNYLGLIRPILAGAQSGMGHTVGGLVKAADFISKKLGIPQSDAARMIARDLETYAQVNRAKGVQGIPGKVAEGLGSAAVAIPQIASLGPYGMAVQGGLQGLTEGGLPGAVQGAVQGGLSQGVLAGTAGLPLAGRVGSGAAFGAATTPGGIKDRVSGAATMGALGAMGGQEQRRVVDLRDKIQAKPQITEAKPAAGPQTPAQILTEALKQSEVVHPERQAAWSQEYGERFAKAEDKIQELGGSEGLKAGRAQMAGKMPTISFEPPVISPEVAEALKVEISRNNLLTTGERFQTEAGLDRLLGGDFPAPKQTELLNRVFGGELIDVLTQKKGKMAQLKYWAGQIANVPRSVMASFDLSAPLRQGVWLVGHPKEFFGGFKDMFQSFGSRAGYQAVVNNITSRPTFDLMKRSGLALTEMGSTLRKTEEQFLGANILERGGAWAEKKLGLAGKAINMPVKGIEASQRAYTGFLNKLRADMFDKLVKDASDLGMYNKKNGERSFYANKKLSDDIAWYVNAATGRGKLGKTAESGANLLNSIFFSPRLMSSRLTLLNPRTYLSSEVSPFVRRAALKDAIKFGAIYTTISAAAMLTGKAVGDNETLGADPRSADFGKIRIGNTRIDLGGGFGQYIRELALIVPAAVGKIPRSVGGKGFDWYTVNSTTGKKRKIGGGFNETSIKDLLYNFFESKENPILSFATTIAGERAFGGEKINLGKELANRITPIIVQDIIDMAKDDPEILKMAPIAIASIFGAGVQTYGKKK